MTVYSVAPVQFGVGISGTTTTLGVNDPELGTTIRVGKLDYVFVYNAGGASVPVGHAVICSAVTGYSVTVSALTGVDLAIGVRQHSTMGTATYGWVATRGIGTVKMTVSESAASGQLLCVGVDGGFGLKSNSTDFKTPGVAKALEAFASAASGQAFFAMF